MPEAVTRSQVMRDEPVRTAVAASGVSGDEALGLVSRMIAVNRSLTGPGVRQTLGMLAETLPLELTEIASGTRVFDWTVPPEWSVRGAWIADSSGRRLVDLADNYLHVLGYSAPIHARMTGAELEEHLHWLPDRPEAIPFRTSYFDPSWGFCVTGDQRSAVHREEIYEVVIDSTLDESGSLTYAELVLPGRSEQEILLSTYICHPSLANEISGIALLAGLGRALLDADLHFSYRLLFAPGTIGPLTWLMHNEDRLGVMRHGMIVSCVGDRGPLTYKRSRRGTAEVDRAAAHVLGSRPGGSVRPFVPWGGDERQFCSPGFDLPIGSLTRTPHADYPEYHTSADDLSFIGAAELEDSLDALAEILDVLEGNVVLESSNPKGEPQLSRRGLYETIGAGRPHDVEIGRQALLWVLNAADGTASLLDMVERAGLPFSAFREAGSVLEDAGLVREVGR